ncbi:hypothetical protein LCGC14_2609020 [marine sediment metagenome]|uniref:Uncharacterized protein n=1 Tax=marine sediment metagenome TaxID=412755 RepID=A0A0F9AU32_9ZZZZ
MSDPRGFVSFDFDHDGASRVLFVGQSKKDARDLSQYPEGKKFHNKETGETLMLRGGKLVPVPK